MDKLSWVKELVKTEQEMEERGIVDNSPSFDPDSILVNESIKLLQSLKENFIEAASAFNNLKGSAIGRVKIYGVSKTHADFMLFRNGLKLIIGFKEPGVISIRFHMAGSSLSTGSNERTTSDEDSIQAHWGAFGDLVWTYQDLPIKNDYLVRYYLTRFIRESAK